MKTILLLTFSLVTMAATAGELYRYVDKNGRVVYSDQPPPQDARSAERKRLGEIKPDHALPFATREAVKRYPVTLYANACGDVCDRARALLEKRGVPFTQIDPESSPEALATLEKLVGAKEVPVLLVGKTKPIKGFEAGSWGAALDSAGYPKSFPGVQSQAPKTPAPKPTANAAAPTATMDKKPAPAPSAKRDLD